MLSVWWIPIITFAGEETAHRLLLGSRLIMIFKWRHIYKALSWEAGCCCLTLCFHLFPSAGACEIFSSSGGTDKCFTWRDISHRKRCFCLSCFISTDDFQMHQMLRFFFLLTLLLPKNPNKKTHSEWSTNKYCMSSLSSIVVQQRIKKLLNSTYFDSHSCSLQHHMFIRYWK